MEKTSREIITENLKSIEEWAFQGMSQKDIADCLGIGYSTFRKIKAENVALLAVFEKVPKYKNKEREKIKNVEKSLYERAKGYEYESIEYVKVKSSGYDEKGKKWEKEEVIEKPVKIHVPADVQAAKFFLFNRNKQEWKENPHKVQNDKELLELRKKEIKLKEW